MDTRQRGQIATGLIIVLGILLAGVAMLLIRYRFSTAEDYWKCQNGEWVQIGMLPLRPKPSTVCPQAADIEQVSRPDEVVGDFYDRYMNAPDNMLETKSYETDDALTQSFKDGIAAKAGSGQDPFYCASDKPVSVQPAAPSVQTDKAIVALTEQFADRVATVSVSLAWEGDAWRINEVACTVLPEVAP